ncbi:Pentatricopeptide repeat-containing protein [Apostasia shenzhenica]|uniref:acyl-[acyl-carrier-protein] 4-desaturase n=1 Tax=Apostasia shenzhenica TaxID=1088818 RepID=A0A2I0B8M4_9ASPA|nr:Pentatricopeptide repeat-containing protein [Apostasia shenzhenica]
MVEVCSLQSSAMSQHYIPAFHLSPHIAPGSCFNTTVSFGFLPPICSLPPRPSCSAYADIPLTLFPDEKPIRRSAAARRDAAIRSRLSQLCKEGRPDLARRIFDQLPRPVPTLLWNTLLIGYVSNSMPDDALCLYQLMNFSHSNYHSAPAAARSDHYTYSSVLKACADSWRLRLGQSIHCHILRRSPAPPTNHVLNNSLLNMYASTALDANSVLLVDVVRLLFDRMRKRNVVAWNTLIAWYVRTCRPAIALEQFRSLIVAGIRPSTISFVIIFPAAASVGAIVDSSCWADSLFSLLVKHGTHIGADVFVVSSAISMYSELSEIQSARRIFDCAIERNIEVWNTMIGGYVQNAFCEEAIAMFLQVLGSDEVAADNVTFLASLTAVSQLQDIGLGRQIHACIIKRHLKPLPLILCNALMVMYSRCDAVESALDIFHQMSERDTVTWNTMISSFVQKGQDLEGLRLVYKMQKEGFAVDSVTVAALLSAGSNLGSLRVGKETHGYLVRQGIEFEGMLSYLIDMYAKSDCIEAAKLLFDEDECHERDQVTWNAMIAGYMRNEQHEEAITLFKKMLERKHLPDQVTTSLILPACDPVGGIQAGKEIHGFAIRHHLVKNVFVGTAIVDMYSRCGGIILAEKVFNRMTVKNRVTYNTMLSGFGQHGLGERALSLFNSMQSLGVKPDAVTFIALISACSYCGLIDEGLAIFESMDEFGVVATIEHYCCVVDLLGRGGRVEQAYDFVQGLGDKASHVSIWGSLLGACKVHGKYELGSLVSKRLLDIESSVGNSVAGYHVLMSNVYASDGKWDGVHRVRQVMKDTGLKKEPGSSWIEIRDASHRFMSRDQNHPQSDQINEMLRWLALEMRSQHRGSRLPIIRTRFPHQNCPRDQHATFLSESSVNRPSELSCPKMKDRSAVPSYTLHASTVEEKRSCRAMARIEQVQVRHGKRQMMSMMSSPELEVFRSMGDWVENNMLPLLKPVEDCWQPQDFLPDPSSEDFPASVADLKARAATIPDELLVCLAGNMITEEALPTYQSIWDSTTGGSNIDETAGASSPAWARWARAWSGEENRHGDLLNKYLYLTGRLDMRQVEKTIQYLIAAGMDPQTDLNPYCGLVYTSFQEKATFISHGNTARQAGGYGDVVLAKICGIIAADEKRHETAYVKAVKELFRIDPDRAMLAFAQMMKKRITMPARSMFDGRELHLFAHFSALAQRVGVYSAADYVDIVEFLVKEWEVESLAAGLSPEGRQAQDYVCRLPAKLRKWEERVREKTKIKDSLRPMPFTWISDRHVMI